MAEVKSEGLLPEPKKRATEKSPKVLVNGEEIGDNNSDDEYQDAVSSHSEDEAEQRRKFRGHGSHTDNSHSENESKPSEESYSPPSEELKYKIVEQVEHYLSVDSLSRDAFLLKHVRRNKEGYVNLKLITSFKKVRSLTKDYRVVAEALKVSKSLSMNDELTKVRRNIPLPKELLERNPGRTVVATNLEDPSFEKVSENFTKCGEIVLIRILRPGKPVPVDLKVHFGRHPELETEVCAVVEFETMAAAARACGELTKEGGMKVVELGFQPGKKEKKLKMKGEGQSDGGKDSEDEHEEKKKKKRRNKKNKRIQDLVNGSGENYSSNSSCASDSDSSYSPFSSCHRRYNSPSGTPDRQSPAGSPRPSPHTSPRPARKIIDNWRAESPEPRASPASSPEQQRRRNSGDNTTPKKESNSAPNSPWSQRRKIASPNANHSPNTSPLASEGVRHRMVQLEGVNRLPRGPDGTRGFHGAGRGRPLIQVA